MPPRITNFIGNNPTIDPTFSPKGVRDKIKGGSLATQATRDAALYSQTQCIPRGRRILVRAGIQGQPSTLVLDGTNPNGVGLVYPAANAERIMARQRVRLTPGYAVGVVAVCLPNGPAQQSDGLGGYVEGKPGGSIRINLILDNGIDNPSVGKILYPKTSNLQYKKLPPAAGGCWDVLETLSIDQILVTPQSDAEPGWVEGVTATITITAIGGARPIDVTVYERPYRAVHDESHREGCVPNFPPSGAGSEYPITAVFQDTNPIKGSQQASKTLQDQRQIFGPTLMHWTCWNEDTATIVQTEGAPRSITSTTFVGLNTGTIAFGGAWSVSSGAYARNIEQSGKLALRDVIGTIPVIVRAYARVTNNAYIGTIRFRTSQTDWRDLVVTGSTAFQWYSGLAWIRVPVHASLEGTLQVLCKVGGAGQTMEVRYLSVEYGGHYQVTQ